MDNRYDLTKNTVSRIKYHFVFCARYRRKVFLIPGLRARLESVIKLIGEKQGFQVLETEQAEDFIHLVISSPPNLSPASIIHSIKNESSTIIRAEFKELSKMPGLWTNKYLVSTEDNLSSEDILCFVESQKKRY